MSLHLSAYNIGKLFPKALWEHLSRPKIAGTVLICPCICGTTKNCNWRNFKATPLFWFPQNGCVKDDIASCSDDNTLHHREWPMWKWTFHVLPTGKDFFKTLIKADRYLTLLEPVIKRLLSLVLPFSLVRAAKGCQCTEIGVGSNWNS